MGALHPQVIHFAVALTIVGVAFRLISLARKPAWVSPAAAALLLLGVAAVWAAVWTGDAAHGPVEQMPGLRGPVTDHEEWGERTGYVFLVVAVIELAALALYRTTYVRTVYIASTVVGLIGIGFLYEAGEHGGRIVYDYAGGVGTRSGDEADVQRLHLAALYQRAMAARKAGHADRANELFVETGQRFPKDVDVQLLIAESQLTDKKDPPGAIEQLRRITPAPDNSFQRLRHGMLLANALDAAGQRPAAIATLQQLQSAFPNSARIGDRLKQLQGKP
jgi:uncharacterized membrane protein